MGNWIVPFEEKSCPVLLRTGISENRTLGKCLVHTTRPRWVGCGYPSSMDGAITIWMRVDSVRGWTVAASIPRLA